MYFMGAFMLWIAPLSKKRIQFTILETFARDRCERKMKKNLPN